jgi:hypothetical protein
MVEDLISDLQDSGAFELITPSPVLDSVSPVGWYVLEAKNCDPLYEIFPSVPSGFVDNQNWRIAIDAHTLEIAWGSRTQIDESLTIRPEVVQPLTASTYLVMNMALIGRTHQPNPSAPYEYSLKYPFHYKLVTTDHGFAITVYPQTKEDDAWLHRTLCIQRPTNPKTGETKIDGGAPVFAVYNHVVNTDNSPWYDATEEFHAYGKGSGASGHTVGIDGKALQKPEAAGNRLPGWFYGLVRDVLNPSSSDPVPMNIPSKNLFYSFDWTWWQPAFYDTLNAIVKFPTGMCINGRYIYFDEMDMIGMVNGSIFPFEKETTIELYNPPIVNTYQAGVSHKKFVSLDNEIQMNPGQASEIIPWARLVMLKSGPSVL